MNPNNKLNFNESFNQGHNLNEHNFQESFLPEITYENDNIIATHNSTGEERFFINFLNFFQYNYLKIKFINTNHIKIYSNYN